MASITRGRHAAVADASTKEKPRSLVRVRGSVTNGVERSELGDVGGLQPLGTLLDLELDPLTFLQ